MDFKLDLDKFKDAKEDTGIDESVKADFYCSPKQSKMIYTLLGEIGMDKEDFGVESTSGLKRDEASNFIEELLRIQKEQEEEEINERLENFDDFYDQMEARAQEEAMRGGDE